MNNNVYCPFCHKKIKPIYITETVIKKKRKKRNRVSTYKKIIGYDYDTHKETCEPFKKFSKL